MAWLEKGLDNLAANVRIVGEFGVPAVVALNRFTGDTDAEVDRVLEAAPVLGAAAAAVCDVWARGGAGGAELARAVVDTCRSGSSFDFLYGEKESLRDKIETVAARIYGADGVDLSPEAEGTIERYEDLGFGSLPVNMAKTHLSLSHDPETAGGAHGVPAAGAGRGALGGGRLPGAPVRRDPAHAGAAVEAGLHEPRPRRRRRGGGSGLSAAGRLSPPGTRRSTRSHARPDPAPGARSGGSA